MTAATAFVFLTSTSPFASSWHGVFVWAGEPQAGAGTPPGARPQLPDMFSKQGLGIG